MAANTSPSLTNSSHTMTALPLVSVPPTGVNGESNNKVLLALLESLRPDKRHVFLQPSDALPTGSLNVVKETLEGFAGEVGEEQEVRLKESRKRKREGRGEVDVLKLRRVYVDGFETEQVWQQARRIIGSVLKFSDGLLDELEEEGEVVAADQVNGQDDDGEEEEEVEDDEDIEGEEDEEEDEEEELDVELDEDQLEDGLEGQDDEDLDELEDGLEDELNEDEDEEDEDEQDVEEYVEDPDGLNDGFFNLEEFNRQSQYFEEQDARGDPNTDRASDDEDIDWDADPMSEPKAGSKKASNRKSQDDDEDQLQDEDDEESDEEDGPTFGDMALDAPEGESDDEALNDEAADDEGMDFNANEVYFKDFFAPPPRKSKGGKPKKSVHFQPEKPTEEDVDRAMADVRRDLFDDESDNDDSEDALSDVSAGDPKSRRSAHERRQAKLAEEIRKLEAASVAKREWTLSGEASAVDRPQNSLLEEDLDFEHVGKPVPVITPEVTEGIEDMIKRRILAQQFDEVLRRRPDAEAVPSGTRRGIIEVDDSKSSKGLAEVYEEEHVKNANPDTYVSQSDEKLQREEKEIEAMWKDVSSRLDALSSWNYRPKPSAATVSVVSDVAAVAMEDAQPTTASAISGQSSRLAPQEVYKAGADNAAQGEVVTSGGMPLARQELSREDKVRRRRREKERMRKAGGADAAKTNGAAGGAKKTLSAKVKMQRETIAELKKGGVKVINRKGEITDVEGKKTKVAAKIVSGGSYKL